jgi:hypothetical protein
LCGVRQQIGEQCEKLITPKLLVAGQFEIPVNSNQERISRKGAKAQRRRRKEQAALNNLCGLPLRLCAFARTSLFLLLV